MKVKVNKDYDWNYPHDWDFNKEYEVDWDGRVTDEDNFSWAAFDLDGTLYSKFIRLSGNNSEPKGKIYIAGPMRGYPAFNFKAFFAAQIYLESVGWEVVNPAEVDVESLISPLFEGEVPEVTQTSFVLRDIPLLVECDAIYLLEGHHDSRGAMGELGIARWLRNKVFFQSVVEENKYAREGEGGSCETD